LRGADIFSVSALTNRSFSDIRACVKSAANAAKLFQNPKPESSGREIAQENNESSASQSHARLHREMTVPGLGLLLFELVGECM
jgi:hypothetical protein